MSTLLSATTVPKNGADIKSFHNGGPYHTETYHIGFFMIGTSIMNELRIPTYSKYFESQNLKHEKKNSLITKHNIFFF